MYIMLVILYLFIFLTFFLEPLFKMSKKSVRVCAGQKKSYNTLRMCNITPHTFRTLPAHSAHLCTFLTNFSKKTRKYRYCTSVFWYLSAIYTAFLFSRTLAHFFVPIWSGVSVKLSFFSNIPSVNL